MQKQLSKIVTHFVIDESQKFAQRSIWYRLRSIDRIWRGKNVVRVTAYRKGSTSPYQWLFCNDFAKQSFYFNSTESAHKEWSVATAHIIVVLRCDTQRRRKTFYQQVQVFSSIRDFSFISVRHLLCLPSLFSWDYQLLAFSFCFLLSNKKKLHQIAQKLFAVEKSLFEINVFISILNQSKSTNKWKIAKL